MSNYLVYLSGPITGLTYGTSTDWREYATKCFPPHIQGLSPLRGHRMLDGMGLIDSAIMEHPYRTDPAINRRDKFDTLRADAILVNLIGATRVSIGTVMEMAWAYDHNIPIVLAMEPEGNLHEHAMLRDCVTVRVSRLEEAIEAATCIVCTHDSLVWTRIEQNQMLREEGRLDLSQEPLKENHGGSTRPQ